MGYFDDFKLGVGGLVDLATRADDKLFDLAGVAPDSILRKGGLPNTHLAAEIYTVQSTVNASEAEKAAVLARAKRLTDAGALEQAASNTFDQVAAGSSSMLKKVLIAGAIAAGVVVALKGWKLVTA